MGAPPAGAAGPQRGRVRRALCVWPPPSAPGPRRCSCQVGLVSLADFELLIAHCFVDFVKEVGREVGTAIDAVELFRELYGGGDDGVGQQRQQEAILERQSGTRAQMTLCRVHSESRIVRGSRW